MGNSMWHPGPDRHCLRSYPDDIPCGGRCLGMGIWAAATRIAALGGSGTSGISRFGLVAALRTYRLVPEKVRAFLNRHPEQGSSAQGLAAAMTGLGVAGVMAALASCGCQSRVGAGQHNCASLRISNCYSGSHRSWP